MGIDFDYSNKDNAKFTICDFIEDILKEAKSDMNELLKYKKIEDYSVQVKIHQN